MRAASLEDRYMLLAPANWQGTYISNNGYYDGSWSWYKDGNPQLVNFPHVTLAFGLAHEVAPGSGQWIGFHVSVPIIGTGFNGRFNYSIAGGVVTFANTTTATLPALERAAVIAYGNANARMIDEFAMAFYDAAVRDEALAGVAGLFA